MDWIKNRFPSFKKILAVCHTEKQSWKENNLQEIKYHLQLSFSMLSVIKLYLGKNRAFCIQFSAVPLCDAPVRSQPILMMTLSVAMATCLHYGTGHAKLRMGLLERSLVVRVIQSLMVLKNSKCSKKNDLGKEDGIMSRSTYFKVYLNRKGPQLFIINRAFACSSCF